VFIKLNSRKNIVNFDWFLLYNRLAFKTCLFFFVSRKDNNLSELRNLVKGKQISLNKKWRHFFSYFKFKNGIILKLIKLLIGKQPMLI